MRKRRKFVVIIVLVLTICCAVFAYLNSDYYYSKLLSKAITTENTFQVLEIVEKRPSCVNSYPTLAPIWWQSLNL